MFIDYYTYLRKLAIKAVVNEESIKNICRRAFQVPPLLPKKRKIRTSSEPTKKGKKVCLIIKILEF